MGYLIVFYLIAAYFFGWWPLDSTERAIDNSDFNVHFYYPNNKEEYVGYTTGLSSCGSLARSHAYQKGVQNSSWSYICCRVTSDSSCESKHR